MRLLDTLDHRLQEFYDAKIPEYAILSHVWGDEEVSLQMLERIESKKSYGYTKIMRCCDLALSQGWKYVWIDTCCIDKTSSADLSEAINSMYRWYQNAQVCNVYMADVSANNEHLPFRNSRWFSRGWTLQELLAPWTVVFYDTNWNDIGTKWGLIDDISQITYITQDQMIDHKRVNIAVKMSWASLRRTTRLEDTAYCLMGLFDINMPLLYGEGSKAFMRLQHEILLTHEGDESIFAWKDTKSSHCCGLLAWSPAAFRLSGDIRLVKNPNADSEHPSVSKRVLTMSGLDFRAKDQPNDSFRYSATSSSYIKLNCVQADLNHSIVGIDLTDQDQDHVEAWISRGMQGSSARDYYVRSSPGTLMQCKSFRSSAEPGEPSTIRRTMKISLDHVPSPSLNKQQQIIAILPSPLEFGYAASENYPSEVKFVRLPSVFPLKTRPEGWKAIFELSWSYQSSLAAFTVVIGQFA